MMNWNDYRKEIDTIKIKKDKKEQWILNIEEPLEQKKYKLHIPRYALVGTCFLLILSAFLMFTLFQEKQSIKKSIEVKLANKELPKISISQNSASGFGFSGIMLPDASYFGKGNPMLENPNIKTLPVYKNGFLTDGRGTILRGEMKKEQIDKIINHYRTIFHFSQTADETLQYSTFVEARYKEGNINVNRNGGISIDIKKDRMMNKNLDFTVSNQEEAEKLAMKFANYFKEELELSNPKPYVACEFDIDYVQKWHYRVYDEEKTIKDTVFAYNFRSIEFSASKTYISIAIDNSSVDDKIGDYPMITNEKAKRLFHDGQYISNSLPPAQGADIAFMEVVYWKDHAFDNVLPYYKIYVEMEEGLMIPMKGLKNYGIYYIPAVSSEYLDINLLDTSLTFN